MVTSRPLLMFAGMTSFDVSVDLSTYKTTTVDALGTATTETRLNRDLNLTVAHSFGLVQLSAHAAGPTLSAGASVATGCSGRISLRFGYNVPQTTYRYYYSQSLGYTYRVLRLPQRLALFASAFARLSEQSLTPPMEMASSGRILSASASGSATVQLASRLVFDFGVGVSVPVSKSASLIANPTTELGAHVELIQTFHRWDFYANFSLQDLTGARRPFGSVGFVHRWGN